MAENYRNSSGRSDEWRGDRYSSADRDRNRNKGEHRFGNERDDRGRYERGFEGERPASQGSYAEDFGSRGGRDRDDIEDRDTGGRYSQSSRYGEYDRPSRGRYEEDRFGAGDRFQSPDDRSYADRDLGGPEFTLARDRGTSTSRWHEDLGSGGGYFTTGSYIDDGGASRGFGRDFERARLRVQQQNDPGRYRERDRDTSGDYRNYGRSSYGAQSNYARGEELPPWRSQQGGSYDDRSSWNYGGEQDGPERGGSGYGYDRDYRSGSSASRGGSGPSTYGGQSFRGRGPQGYQRSDERLKEMICERLTDDPAIDASDVTIEVTGQCVKLTGTVDDRSTKYEIEELVENFGGVKDIDNQLRVKSSRLGQQTRGGSDWEAGSSSTAASSSPGRAESRSGAGTSTGASTGTSSAGSTGRKN